MPAEIRIPPSPSPVAACPNVSLPDLGDTLPWTHNTPGLQQWASAQLHYPIGTIIRDAIGGRPVIARIECHFKYGAHPEAPGNWHKGTSVYQPARRQGGRLVAIVDLPGDWPTSERA